MTMVSVSPKFQVIIPKAMREALNIQAGQKVELIPYQNRIVLIPVRPVESARGFLKGIDTTVPREDDYAAHYAQL